jgi:hypothetical protein
LNRSGETTRGNRSIGVSGAAERQPQVTECPALNVRVAGESEHGPLKRPDAALAVVGFLRVIDLQKTVSSGGGPADAAAQQFPEISVNVLGLDTPDGGAETQRPQRRAIACFIDSGHDRHAFPARQGVSCSLIETYSGSSTGADLKFKCGRRNLNDARSEITSPARRRSP